MSQYCSLNWFGRCLRTPSTVGPRNDVSQLLLIAWINVVTTGAPCDVWWNACRCEVNLCWYILLVVCCRCITKDCGFDCMFFCYYFRVEWATVLSPRLYLLQLLFCHFLLIVLFIVWKAHYNPRRTGTNTSVLSISISACPFCALGGRSGDRLNCLVVVEFIVVLLAQSTPIRSCGNSAPKYLCCLAGLETCQ